MRSLLGGLHEGGEAGNIATMKSVLGKYETIKDERSGTGTSGGSSSCNSGRSDSIIPGVSNEVLCTELERDIAAVAETLDGGGGDPNGTTAVGTPAPHLDTSNNGNGSRNSSSDSNGINSNGGNGRACSPGNPSTVHQQQPVEQLESYPEAPSPAPRAPSILVVDDSQMSCKLAKRCLSKAKFHVEFALDGELGLAMLHADASSFDLVLLDVVMPGLDGIEMLTRMKQDPRLCHLPVAILSGLDDERLDKLCLQQGATVVLRKPMMADEVVGVVNAHCMPKPAAAAAANLEGTPVGLAAEGTALMPSPPLSWAPLSPSIERSSVAKGADGVDGAVRSGVCGGEVGGVGGDRVCGGGDRVGVGCDGDGDGDVRVSGGRVRGAVVAGEEVGAEGGLDNRFGGGESSSPSCSRNPQIQQLEGNVRQDATASVEDGQGDHPSRPATAGRAATAVDAATEAVTSAIAPTAPAADPISPVCTSAKGDGGGSGRLENESWGAASCSESTSPTSPMENKAISRTKMTVLIVDDSVISSKLAIRKLRTLGYAAISAENGQAALDILRRFPERVSFVLVDIVMPVMNGVELLHVIKNDPNLCQIPVVVVSSLERQQLETLCLESGALAVLRKPLNASAIQAFAAQVGLALPTLPQAIIRPLRPSTIAASTAVPVTTAAATSAAAAAANRATAV